MTGKKVFTMDDIAKLAGVSKPTVSRALSNSSLVKPETKQRVLAVARSHGYAVNRNAQKLRHKRTHTIAVSLDYRSHKKNHISDPFIFNLLAGVSEALGKRNQDLLLCAPNHNDMDAFRRILSSRSADGFIMLGQGHRSEMLNEFARAGAPMVVWGAATEDTPYCVVGSDNYYGGQLAGNYFREHGRRRLLFVGDPAFAEIYWRRVGLQQVGENKGPDVTIDDIVLSDFSFDAAFEAATKFLGKVSEPPDAVFACSDTAAMAFITALGKNGLNVPRDVSVVGYNDIRSAAFFSPAVTTIRQDTYQAGRLLVSNLMQTLDGEAAESTKIETSLIVRET